MQTPFGFHVLVYFYFYFMSNLLLFLLSKEIQATFWDVYIL